MRIEIEGVGEFMASDEENTALDHYGNQLPHYSPAELLTLLYLAGCLDFARFSKGFSGSMHVSAVDILTAAPVRAVGIFGESAQKWLRALNLGSSLAIGQAVSKLIEDGIFTLREGDRIEDFETHSPLDDFMNSPVS